MSGNVQQTSEQIGNSGYWVVTMRWTGDSNDGSVPATLAKLPANLQGGRVSAIEVAPGNPAPSAGYSVTLADSLGLDLLSSQGSSLSAVNAASFSGSSTSPPLLGSFTLSIAGNTIPSAKGAVLIYLNVSAETIYVQPVTVNTPPSAVSGTLARTINSARQVGLLATLASIKAGNTTASTIAVMGDSWTIGGTWTGPLTTRLQQGLGNAGIGYLALDEFNAAPQRATTGTWADATSIYSPHTGATSSTDFATPAQKVITTVAVDTFVIYYRGGSGIFRYKIDAGGWTSVDTSAQIGNQALSVTAGALGTHALYIQPVSGAAVLFFGVDCRATVAGVRVSALARSGQTAQFFGSLDQAALTVSMTSINPSVVIIMLAINDWQTGRTSAQFTSDLAGMIAKVRIAAPNTDIILATQADSGYPNASGYAPFVVAIQSLATINNLIFLDLYDTFGPFAVSNAWGVWNGAQHPNTIGGQLIAELILAALPGLAENISLRANFNGLAGNGTNPFISLTDGTSIVKMQQVTGGGGYIGTQTNTAFNFLVNNIIRGTVDTTGSWSFSGLTGQSSSINLTANPNFLISDGTITAKVQASTGAAAAVFGSQSNHPVQFLVNNAVKGTFDSSGLAIASTTPNQKMSVSDGTGVVKAQINAGVAYIGMETAGIVNIIANNIAAMSFQTSGQASLAVVPVYANNAAAIGAGLAVGSIYRLTGTDQMGVVH